MKLEGRMTVGEMDSEAFFMTLLMRLEALLDQRRANAAQAVTKYEELKKLIKLVLPDAYLSTDNNAQIIVYTNLMKIDESDELVEFEE